MFWTTATDVSSTALTCFSQPLFASSVMKDSIDETATPLLMLVT